jgi:hypothetical protein
VDIRLIIDPPQNGAWNMAVDEALLLDAIEDGSATLRFYQWSEPTLSLGYFQRYADRNQHHASRNCAIVRRQSGGGAILHDRELTYSLVLPPGHPLGRNPNGLPSNAAATRPSHPIRRPSLSCASSASRRATWSWFRQKILPLPVTLHGKSWAALSDVIAAPSCSTEACCWKNRRPRRSLLV